MSRWSLLKSSLVEKKRDCDSSSSIHRFNGYNVIERRKIPWMGFRVDFTKDEVNLTSEQILCHCRKFMEGLDSMECIVRIDCGVRDFENIIKQLLSHPTVRQGSTVEDGVELYVKYNGNFVLTLPKCDYWCYSLDASSDPHSLVILWTREKPRDCGLNVRGLLSNKLYGVDNTGNVCVWPAEPLLLHTILNVPRFTELVRNKRVVEIGGGMTALAGLGLAAAGLCSYVAVTDGHPDCVKNQAVCIQMNKQQKQSTARRHNTALMTDLMTDLNSGTYDDCTAQRDVDISSSLLHWSLSVNAEQVAALTCDNTRAFDVVIASDCLFFKDFHADLVQTLQLLLAPDGVGIFLQPTRDRTLQKFIDVCAETGAFNTELIEDYSPVVSAMRAEYLKKKDTLGYEEDIHYPVMLILKKK